MADSTRAAVDGVAVVDIIRGFVAGGVLPAGFGGPVGGAGPGLGVTLKTVDFFDFYAHGRFAGITMAIAYGGRVANVATKSLDGNVVNPVQAADSVAHAALGVFDLHHFFDVEFDGLDRGDDFGGAFGVVFAQHFVGDVSEWLVGGVAFSGAVDGGASFD